MLRTKAMKDLTERQQEVVRLVVEGLRSREIGERLKISPRTVEVHRANLMRRLKVHNVAQLMRAVI